MGIVNTENSERWFKRAQQVIPGGVNSPVRAFRAVGGNPLFIREGKGAYLIDEDGNRFLDYVSSFGPLIFGHACPEVVEAITKAVQNGTTYGAPCRAEVELAEKVCAAIPSMEQVRMVNSGTEATMSAIRLARAYTGRDKIIKFEGCYHGHGDSFLVQAGSGMLTEKIPASPGVPASILEHTLICRYNDIESVKQQFAAHPEEIAAVIIEPVPANMGLVLPQEGFLPALADLTHHNGAALIFDEVITGFRTCYGGYQNRIGIEPDLTTLGKIIGGGLPVGAYGGKRALMEMVAPSGSVYQAGTLSGNPLAMAAGISMLSLLEKSDGIYTKLEERAVSMAAGIRRLAQETGVPVVVNQLASLLTVFFTAKNTVQNYADVLTADTAQFQVFHRSLLEQGVYFPPSQFEVAFLSAAQTEEDIAFTLNAMEKAFAAVKQTIE